MPPIRKIRAVEELTAKLSRSSVAIATDFSGMSVNSMTELRQHLRSQGIEYRVVKNTLTERAADAAGHPEVKEVLEGPTGLALGYGDSIQPIKVLMEYIRTNHLPMVLRAAVLEGRVFRDAQLSALIALPSREVLAARLVGSLSAPLVGPVSCLDPPRVGSDVVCGLATPGLHL